MRIFFRKTRLLPGDVGDGPWRKTQGVAVGLHCVHQKAEFIAQSLVAVGHANLRHVGPLDVVALRPVLQVVGTNEVFLLLQTIE